MKRARLPGSRKIFIVAVTLCLALFTMALAEGAESVAAPGTFLGSDLLTEDADKAASFYAELFGWDVEKVRDGSYAIHHQGRLIASVTQIDGSIPDASESFWLVGIAVAEVDEAVKQASQLGAEILESVTTIEGYGRFAAVSDPQGAPVMLIEPLPNSMGKTSGPGSWVWSELWTNDLDKAAAFYAKVIGYQSSEIERDGEKFQVFKIGEEVRAGLVKIPAELENLEPGWAPYVDVENLAKAMARVRKLGGQVVFASDDNPGRGAVALITDPTGAAVFIHEIGSARKETK